MTAADAAASALRASAMRLRSRNPFFGTLALYARFIARDDIETAATDGRDVFYNPGFVLSLPAPQLDGVLVHEVLHAALGHLHRRRDRHPLTFNQAADIVINGLIASAGIELPPEGLRDTDLERFSAEEVYAILARGEREVPAVAIDLFEPAKDEGATGDERKRADARHWAAAIDRAAAVTRAQAGALPLGVERAFDLDERPKLDWRTVLWRYLSRTPTDFTEYDRRHVHRGLYVETLETIGLRVVVGVDTSGSIDQALLSAFLGELRGILGTYHGTDAWLIYVDTEAYGPYRLSVDGDIPPPQGGGGTDFRPFFATVDEAGLADDQTVAVYLTDGEGTFPEDPPQYPILWVVTPGGLESGKFPFGDCIRLFEI